MNKLLSLVVELIEASGRRRMFETALEFNVFFPQAPYDPLHIKSCKAEYSYFGESRHISLAHLASFPDEQEPDLDPLLWMTEHGIPLELRQHHYIMPVVTTLPSGNILVYTSARLFIESIMDKWAEIIREQNWLAVAAEYRASSRLPYRKPGSRGKKHA